MCGMSTGPTANGKRRQRSIAKPARAIAASGWTIERVRRFASKAGPVALPHIIGAARRPG